MSHSHARSSRRALGFVLAVTLAASSLVSGAAPAAAATTPPWRFTTVSESFTLGPGEFRGSVLPCPAGYLPLSGGVTYDADHTSGIGLRRNLDYINLVDRTYHVGLYSSFGSQSMGIKVSAHCVWAENLGPIHTEAVTFARNSTTERAGGTVSCPVGWRVISGGADWVNGHQYRTIDYSSPVLDDGGYGAGWYASGRQDNSGGLYVEAHCIEAAYLESSFGTVNLSAAASTDYQQVGTTATCPFGSRILTGGAYPWGTAVPTQDRGYAWASGPSNAFNWPAKASVRTGGELRAVAICIPVSVPSVSFTQTPPLLSKSRTARFTIASSDPVGEDLSAVCRLDANPVTTCPVNGSFEADALQDGTHVFYVTVKNKSDRSATAPYQWTVDKTAPTVAKHEPPSALGVTAPITITFSEAVKRASQAAVQVHGQDTDTDVTGTLAKISARRMTWTPRRPLVPGETYRVSLTNEIRDIAGNALIPTFWDIRTARTVQNASPALHKSWDVDQRPVASDDRYITSRTQGTSAALTVVATQGQVASIYGIKLPSGGLADIYLDGVKTATRSFYAAAPDRVKVYATPPLSAGTHTISIRALGTRPSGSSGAWVSVDNLTVGSTTHQDSVLRQTFARIQSANASGGSYDVVTHVTDSDGSPAYIVRLVGAGARLYATKTPSSGSAQIYVDGVLKKTVNLRASAAAFKALIYSGTFPAGPHTIRIRPVGTTTGGGSAVSFDYLSVM